MSDFVQLEKMKIIDRLGEIYQEILKLKRLNNSRPKDEILGLLDPFSREMTMIDVRSNILGLRSHSQSEKFYMPKINALKKKTFSEARDIISDLIIDIKYNS